MRQEHSSEMIVMYAERGQNLVNVQMQLEVKRGKHEVHVSHFQFTFGGLMVCTKNLSEEGWYALLAERQGFSLCISTLRPQCRVGGYNHKN